MKKIIIRTIPHKQQRYDTAGDFYSKSSLFTEDTIRINVSNLGNPTYEFLVALHEQIEMFLCQQRGITEKSIDKFDFAWKGEGEPGDDPASPYFKEHQFALIIEKLMAHELGVDWAAYEKRLDEIIP